MTGYTKDENSLASGIPDKNIGPETGSFGNATKTNTGDTAQGTNQDHESVPPPATGFGATDLATDDIGEHRSFASGAAGSAAIAPSDSGVEPVYEQIADGGDRFDPDKRLNDDDDETEIERDRERDRLDRAP